MRLLLPLVCISLFAVANAFADAPLSPRAQSLARHLWERDGSFRRILVSVAGGPMVTEFSDGRPGCGEAIRRVYEKGGSLYSKAVDEAASRLGDFRVGSGVQDNEFFHLTNSEGFARSFEVSDQELQRLNGPVESSFIFLRTRPASFDQGRGSYHSNWGRMFYLSEDTDSLMTWYRGSYGIRFTIDPAARLVTLDAALFQSAFEEIAARYPEIGKQCGTKFDKTLDDAYGTVSFHALAFPVAEDSGIDAIYYFQANHWFQFLNPDSFRSARRIGNVGARSNGNLQHGELAANDRSYLTTPVIVVDSATYGGADVTDVAAAFADGKTKVDYKISGKRLGGGTDDGKTKDFRISYRCLPGGRAEARAPVKTACADAGEAEGKVLPLSCE